MKIIMAASECVPFVKVGGLADVVGTLPKFLKARKNSVAVIIPKYRKIDAAKFNLKRLPHRLQIPLGANYEEAAIMEGHLGDGLPVYFIENARYFDREEVYRTADGDYADNRERFIFFSRAVLETAKYLSFKPDIIHCHDWQTGIIPAYLRTVYRIDGFFRTTSTVYTIHNIAYQGIFGPETVDIAGLSQNDFTWDRLEYYGGFNFMKAGLVYADMISTVSPTYAREILLTAEGRGMEGVLRSRRSDVVGILNGIDCAEWNPETDPRIPAHFSSRDLSGKAICKEELQKSCRLDVRPGVPLIGAVSRLDPQKGYDVIARSVDDIMRSDVQLVILGRGDRDIQDLLARLAARYPGRMSVNLEFNEELAHTIYAGADIFLMPSRFEPCGLGQMIALAYGTIPVVTRTGGLVDTVQGFNMKTKKGNGFVLLQLKPGELKAAIAKALAAFGKKEIWRKLVANAFASDFSWDTSVGEYLKLYRRAQAKMR